jgi:pyridoxamine 5'-phosphate oxidase
MSLRDQRTDYTLGALLESSAPADPLELFATWFAQAQEAKVAEANAMTLATVDAHGQPTARVVLLKGLEYGRFVFFTNYGSRKGRELDANPRAGLLFFWPSLERQVRVDGTVARVEDAVADAYFASRPRASRIGAWASPQSAVLDSRAAIDARFAQAEARFAQTDPPRPEYWGGYALEPHQIEFWQGRPSRLHDRLRYTKASAAWSRDRLAP